MHSLKKFLGIPGYITPACTPHLSISKSPIKSSQSKHLEENRAVGCLLHISSGNLGHFTHTRKPGHSARSNVAPFLQPSRRRQSSNRKQTKAP